VLYFGDSISRFLTKTPNTHSKKFSQTPLSVRLANVKKVYLYTSSALARYPGNVTVIN